MNIKVIEKGHHQIAKVISYNIFLGLATDIESSILQIVYQIYTDDYTHENKLKT